MRHVVHKLKSYDVEIDRQRDLCYILCGPKNYKEVKWQVLRHTEPISHGIG